MPTFIACRSALLAEMVALADGQSLPDFAPCDELATHMVVVRRRGVEVAAEVCRRCEPDVAKDPGYVRSIKKYART